MNEITKITILNTGDGIHIEPVASIYVDQDPFVCFSRMFTRYYIHSYCENELFHLPFTYMPWYIEITQIGKASNLANFALPRYPNIDLALKDNAKILYNCVVVNDIIKNGDEGKKRKSDYFLALAIAKDQIEAVQAAIDYSDILFTCKTEVMDETKLKAAKKMY